MAINIENLHRRTMATTPDEWPEKGLAQVLRQRIEIYFPNLVDTLRAMTPKSSFYVMKSMAIEEEQLKYERAEFVGLNRVSAKLVSHKKFDSFKTNNYSNFSDR